MFVDLCVVAIEEEKEVEDDNNNISPSTIPSSNTSINGLTGSSVGEERTGTGGEIGVGTAPELGVKTLGYREDDSTEVEEEVGETFNENDAGALTGTGDNDPLRSNALANSRLVTAGK